jgi:hypothetical protein
MTPIDGNFSDFCSEGAESVVGERNSVFQHGKRLKEEQRTGEKELRLVMCVRLGGVRVCCLCSFFWFLQKTAKTDEN